MVDTETRRKVAELAVSDLAPHDFARYCVALGLWFGGQIGYAYLAWEATGPGLIFGKEIRRLCYPYIHWHRREESAYPKRSTVPGWHSTRTNKDLLLSDYRRALARGEFVNPSKESIEEAFQYVYMPSGSIGPALMVSEKQGARATHGDRVIADALANLALYHQRKAQLPAGTVPTGSYLDRRQLAQRAMKDSADRWKP